MENTEKKQRKVFLSCGIPGSGKSTVVAKLAAEMGGEIVSRDAIRFSLLKDGEDYFSHESEVKSKYYEAIWRSVHNNEITFIDATHLDPNSRRITLGNTTYHNEDLDITYIALYVTVPLGVALKRNAKREGRACVPETAIANMYARFKKPSISREGFDEVWHINEDGEIFRKELQNGKNIYKF